MATRAFPHLDGVDYELLDDVGDGDDVRFQELQEDVQQLFPERPTDTGRPQPAGLLNCGPQAAVRFRVRITGAETDLFMRPGSAGWAALYVKARHAAPVV